MILTADQLARLEKEIDKRGYYLVGDKKYYSKFQAIVASSKTHFFPTFNFNDDIFSAADWKNEPVESITEIYRQRALQLRSKYDHLVLCYSGGSDSTNILHAFLDNNIPIDEIYFYGPFGSNQGKQGKITNGAEYMIREIDLVAVPYVQELSKKHKFKVTFYDWSDDIINSFKDPDWIWTDLNARLSPSALVRNRLHETRPHLDLSEQGKKVGFIYGVDKPKIIIKDDQYYMGFLDLILHGVISNCSAATGNEWDYDEYFYWTPDMPKLVIKQAHILKNFLESNPVFKNLVSGSHLNTYSFEQKQNWEKIMKKLLYPTVNTDVWQTEKNRTLVFSQTDKWFMDLNDYQARKHWLTGIEEVKRIISPTWFNFESIEEGFVGSWSKLHKIG